MKSSKLAVRTAWMATASFAVILMQSTPVHATDPDGGGPALTLAGARHSRGAEAAREPGRQHSLRLHEKIELLRRKVKYVFVLFQENRSFDHYFGTYPGANGLFSTFPGANPNDPYSQPGTSFGSFQSVIRDTDGSYTTISPFLIPRTIVNASGQTVQLYPEDTYSVDHSHTGYVNDMHADKATKTLAQNDGYALDQEGLHYSTDASGVAASIVNSSGVAPTANPTLQQKQKGEVVMSHIDCDTIPFLWQYADRFVLFDNFHQTATGPSTPNAIAMIAGQVGDTQWALHPGAADPKGLTLPNLTDSAPFPGSVKDTSAVQPPYGPDEATNGTSQTGPFTSFSPQINLTFATLPLSFMGHHIASIVANDQNPAADLADVQHDVLAIAAKNPTVHWGWYQQGYGPEPFDGTSISENAAPFSGSPFKYSAAPEHASYIVHHNGPQYFGYIGDNTQELTYLHGLQQFYTDIANEALPEGGGVFYVRGGYYNNDGLLPIDPNPNVQLSTPGNDDHPNYSDAQISEALVADSVNAIARSRYWSESAIIITYDETDGLYDHQPERFRTYGPDGQPETGGPRIPTIVVSPYAAAHTVSHVYSEHSSMIKFINELFGLTPLAELPDEAAAMAAGAANPALNGPNGPQAALGPADATAGMGDLLEAFDNDRLLGIAPPLPAQYAHIREVRALPHYAGAGCRALHITPTDYRNGTLIDPPPLDFNPRPVQSPGNPYLNTNNNTGGASTGPWPN
ncbi:MAG TPA: alkaline phosphatase family protein [Solirubrobacteraceae bacterium]|nr:alkaline phosphatase family protein [Solirubrobacteraceae bacterium]